MAGCCYRRNRPKAESAQLCVIIEVFGYLITHACWAFYSTLDGSSPVGSAGGEWCAWIYVFSGRLALRLSELGLTLEAESWFNYRLELVGNE